MRRSVCTRMNGHACVFVTKAEGSRHLRGALVRAQGQAGRPGTPSARPARASLLQPAGMLAPLCPSPFPLPWPDPRHRHPCSLQLSTHPHQVVVLTSSMVVRGSDAAVDSADTLPAREMFVTIAPGKLNMDALGSLAYSSSALDPKVRACVCARVWVHACARAAVCGRACVRLCTFVCAHACVCTHAEAPFTPACHMCFLMHACTHARVSAPPTSCVHNSFPLPETSLISLLPVVHSGMQFISKTISLRSTTISFDMLVTNTGPVRKTKIGFTTGPACESEEVRAGPSGVGGGGRGRMRTQHAHTSGGLLIPQGHRRLLRSAAARLLPPPPRHTRTHTHALLLPLSPLSPTARGAAGPAQAGRGRCQPRALQLQPRQPRAALQRAGAAAARVRVRGPQRGRHGRPGGQRRAQQLPGRPRQ